MFQPLISSYNQHYEWRGLRQSRGFRSKTKRVITQFSPHDFTAFNWEGTASFKSYLTVVLLLAVFLAAELNPFYLKVLLPSCWAYESLADSSIDLTLDGTESSNSHFPTCIDICLCITCGQGTLSILRGFEVRPSHLVNNATKLY